MEAEPFNVYEQGSIPRKPLYWNFMLYCSFAQPQSFSNNASQNIPLFSVVNQLFWPMLL